jgi:hypothetical protein
MKQHLPEFLKTLLIVGVIIALVSIESYEYGKCKADGNTVYYCISEII